jgi:hypothetical protein
VSEQTRARLHLHVRPPSFCLFVVLAADLTSPTAVT